MKNLAKYLIAGSMLTIPSTGNSLFMVMSPMEPRDEIADSIMVLSSNSYNDRMWHLTNSGPSDVRFYSAATGATSREIIFDDSTKRQLAPHIYQSESRTESLYEIIIQPQDTWESIAEDLQCYEPGATIDEVVKQSFEGNPRVLNLEPGEQLFYIAQK